MDITETPEYDAGWAWAKEFGRPELSELFTGRDVATPELRKRLFREAARRWPSSPDDLENDLRQTAFVAGGIKAVIQGLPAMSPDSLHAVLEAAMEMGAIWSAEQGKLEAFRRIKAKPAGWWRKRMGEASPQDVVLALSTAWRHDWAKERGRQAPRSKWEILIDTLGPRELWALAEATEISLREDGVPRYRVDSPDNDFEVVSRSVYDGGILQHYAGEIVG